MTPLVITSMFLEGEGGGGGGVEGVVVVVVWITTSVMITIRVLERAGEWRWRGVGR